MVRLAPVSEDMNSLDAVAVIDSKGITLARTGALATNAIISRISMRINVYPLLPVMAIPSTK